MIKFNKTSPYTVISSPLTNVHDDYSTYKKGKKKIKQTKVI